MIVIADSGSTKTDWCIVHKEATYMFHTKGLNPYFVTSQDIVEELQNGYSYKLPASIVTEVYFYGAGCKSKESQIIVRRALEQFFTNAQIVIDSDLVGAAIALYGNKPGVVAILGTGMSIAYWNGNQIQDMMPSLGYILGDEGSGANIGKSFIQLLYYNKLSQSISDEWNVTFQFTLAQVLEQIYKKPYPNRFLASFVPFVYKHKNDRTIQAMLEQIFLDFAIQVETIANKYDCKSVSCVGSVAYFFKDFVYLALQKKSIELLHTESSPINLLVNYYRT
jgi:N-acetylglucosamine kinase-like BadF-type ATPase